jgi:hypothetical protein
MTMVLLIPGLRPVQAEQPQVTIVKTPMNMATKYFDPKRPSRERPPLTPPEEAVCASDFLSDASIGAQAVQTDATHAKATINQIKVTLQLDITIWLPTNPQKWTVEHEEGHRQISEYYYKNADAIARRIAEPYLGKVIDISGRDLRKALSAAVQKVGAEITNEYNKQMPVEVTQDRYDSITEHSRKDIPVPDAVAQAIRETAPAIAQSGSDAENVKQPIQSQPQMALPMAVSQPAKSEAATAGEPALPATSAAVSAEGKVEEQVVGPVAQDVKYVVSPRGVHLASVVRKGSRLIVIVDGVEGPKFDEIVTPTSSYVDPRPQAEAQRVASLAGRPGPDTSARPVIFSKDGRRFAYVGRQSKEWVLMVDGKETVRLPSEGLVGTTVGMSLEFTGEDGKHLMFARSVFGGYELWVDGQKMPGIFGSGGGGTAGTIDPLFTRDGARFAYVAQISRDKSTLILDGKDMGYVGDNLQFTADGQHLFSLVRQGAIVGLTVDGKLKMKTDGINQLVMAPVGGAFAAVVQRLNPPGEFLVVNGKKVEGSDCVRILKVTFSPDSKHFAAVCSLANNVNFVLIDGKKGQQYDGIWMPETLAFSPDSSKVGYIAQSAGKYFAVINEDESEAFDGAGVKFLFSQNGKRSAVCGMRQSPPPNGFKLYIDGKLERIDEQVNCASVTFSPDGSRYAYATSPSGILYLDGKPTALRAEKFAFTPDSKHIAAWGNKPSVDPRQGVLAQFAPVTGQGLFVDGQHVWGTFENQNVRYRAFSPDGQHLYWMTSERPSGPNPKPGLMEAVIYLDGKPVVRMDRVDSGEGALLYPGGLFNFSEPPPAWELGSDGVLTFLGPVGDVVKRFRITPSANTTIVTMLANVEAEAAKAQADAEAQKAAPKGRRNR